MECLVFAVGLVDAMRAHARTAYPEECCGFLLAPSDGGSATDARSIVDVVPAPNRSNGERERRFVILPEMLRVAEEAAARRGALVAGFYHSHPDHPARPSQFDQEHAWPWYAYVILSSSKGDRSPAIGAFELDPERREFRSIGIGAESPRAALGGDPRAAGTTGVREP